MSAPFKASPELEAQLRRDRAARPWLYEGTAEHDAYPTSSRAERMATVGMPIAVKLGVIIGQARRRDALHTASTHCASAFANGLIDRDAVAAIEAAVIEKAKGLEYHRQWWNRIAPPRLLNRVTDRRPRIEHRAKLAASGPMPPHLAMRFTVAELAVMKIVADETAAHGTCRITKKEIGDRARASETTVHNAMRKAERIGLVSVKQRPVQGRKSLPNLVMVIDPEWCLWIARPKYRAIREDRVMRQPTQGANPSTPKSVSIYTRSADGTWRDQEEAFRGSERASSCPPDTPMQGMDHASG